MAKREVQLIGCGFARPIPLIEDGPLALLAAASLNVLLGYCARATDRSLDVKGFDKGGPTGKPCIRRHSPFLKDCSLDLVRMIFAVHGRKAPRSRRDSRQQPRRCTCYEPERSRL